MMTQIARQYALILLVAVAVLFINLGTPSLWDRDEPRNAGCAVEMNARGDWIVPVFNGEIRAAKPVLLYWLIMGAHRIFGVNEFAARFPSAILAVGTALATYHIGRRLFGTAAGLWAAVALLTTLMFGVVARAATPDSTLIFFSTSAILVYVLATFRPADVSNVDGMAEPRIPGQWFPASWPAIVLMYALMGLGVLAKGPVAIVMPTAVIGMFLLIVRLPNQNERASVPQSWGPWFATFARRLLRPFAPRHFLMTCWAMRPLTAIAVVLLVAGPWYIAVGVRTGGEWIEQFLFEENIGRALAPMENHRGSILFYPAAILIGFFPWSVLAVPLLLDTVRRTRGNEKLRPGYLLAACWVGVYVGVFTIAQTKLPNYVTPCYPAIALLTGTFFYHWTRGTLTAGMRWLPVAFAALALVGLIGVVALPITARYFIPGEEWLAVIALVPLIAGVAGIVLHFRGRFAAAGRLLAVTAVVTMVSIFGLVTVRVAGHQESHVLFDAIARRKSESTLAAYGHLESSWVYYAGQPIYELTCCESVSLPADFRFRNGGSRDWRPKPKLDVVEFFAAASDPLLITTRCDWEAIKLSAPRDVAVLAEASYFLKQKQLILIGRPAHSPQTTRRNNKTRQR